MPFELLIGLRYLKAKRRSTFISIITFISTAGVTLGVMALIVVLAVMTGFEEDLKEKILGTNAHIVVIRNGAPMEEYRGVIEKLKGFKGVQAATPFIYNQVMLSSGKNVSGVVLRGIDVASDKQVTRLSSSIVEGNIDELDPEMGRGADATPGLMVGKELAKHLNLFLGDKVNVISPMGNITPLGMMPRMKPFKVTGIFNTGMFEYDSTLAYISLNQAQRFFDLGDTVTGIQLKVEDVYHTDELARSINREMGVNFYARDWMQMNKNILFALKTEKIVMFIILTLIVLVAAFGIASTLFMVVMEKNRDIAILKSMGATAASIMKIFVLEGLIIGIIGTLIGVASGLLLALNLEHVINVIQKITGQNFFSKDIYYLDRFPSLVVPSDVLLISVTAILISFLATLYPAWQASRMLPAEALRYE
ncbi:MAG: lipoprotein-releasing ABC transporter permease subunit [Desulfuromonadaceae bacterium]